MFNEKSDGFVISLAVNKPYRGKQIAQNLMKKLHDQLYHLYGLDNVSLHCRVSNEAAIKLYSDCFDYKCVKKVDGYYDDGEDAWMMSSNLKSLEMKTRMELLFAHRSNSKSQLSHKKNIM